MERQSALKHWKNTVKIIHNIQTDLKIQYNPYENSTEIQTTI